MVFSREVPNVIINILASGRLVDQFNGVFICDASSVG
jgi:hypothetical protein